MKTFRDLVFLATVLLASLYMTFNDRPIPHDISGEALSLRLIERRTLYTAASAIACQGILAAIAAHLFWVRKKED